MKKRYIIGGIGALLLLVLVAAGMSGTGTKEVQVGVMNVSYDNNLKSVESIAIPEGATNVRVVYNLSADDNYGFGANGNIGISSESGNSGQDPFMNGKTVDSKYLEANGGQNITGEMSFTPDKFVVYSGMFDGQITVYATVPA